MVAHLEDASRLVVIGDELEQRDMGQGLIGRRQLPHHPYLHQRLGRAGEDEGEADHQQERKKQVPDQGRPVAHEFQGAGVKERTYALECSLHVPLPGRDDKPSGHGKARR